MCETGHSYCFCVVFWNKVTDNTLQSISEAYVTVSPQPAINENMRHIPLCAACIHHMKEHIKLYLS